MSRQQIGGAVGAIVGGVVAYFVTSGTGTGQGVQYGYLIGPAVGSLESPGADEGRVVEDVDSSTSTRKAELRA